MIVHIVTTIKVDEATWALEYGVEPAAVEADVRQYFNQDDLVSGLNDRKAFGPNAEVVAANITAVIS